MLGHNPVKLTPQRFCRQLRDGFRADGCGQHVSLVLALLCRNAPLDPTQEVTDFLEPAWHPQVL
jgi:hypothetical protein